MTSSEDSALAAGIESAVRATPGVRNVYRVGPPASDPVGRVVAGLRAAETLVAISRQGERVGVETSIAVDSVAGAAVTVRAAHAAIETVLARAGLAGADVRVTVVHVQG